MGDPNRTGAVLYVKAAASERCEHEATLQEQEARCRAYCATMGWSVQEVFVDSEVVGHKVPRAALDKMLSFCRRNRATVGYVVVEDFSRIARDPRLAVYLIVQLNRSHISLYSTLSVRDLDESNLAESEHEGQV